MCARTDNASADGWPRAASEPAAAIDESTARSTRNRNKFCDEYGPGSRIESHNLFLKSILAIQNAHCCPDSSFVALGGTLAASAVAGRLRNPVAQQPCTQPHSTFRVCYGFG